MKSRLHLPLLIACFALLAACGDKVIPTRDGDMPTWMGTLEDLRRYPQNLDVYAQATGENKLLVSPAEQANQAAFEAALGAPVGDAFTLYAGIEQASLEALTA